MKTNIPRGAVRLAASLLMLGASTFAIAPALAQTGKIDPFAAPTATGPSSKETPAAAATKAAPGSPYIVPTAAGWSATSLLTAGNTVKGYTMVGIPDGLGVFDNGDRTVTVVMNHEIPGDMGAVHSHGGKGAFVSRWVINKDTLEVVSGSDFVTDPNKFNFFDKTEKAYVTAAKLMVSPQSALLNITRLCAAELAPVSAFFNAATGKGYNGRIFLNGEEGGNASANRALAWVAADSSAWELPAFGFGKVNDMMDPPPSWENLLANPNSGDATVVMADSDGGTNQVHVYIGTKQTNGSPVEKAGLTNGKIWAISVPGTATEDRNTNVGLTKSVVGKGTGKDVALAEPNKGTTFLRPEDGAWDPRNPNRFYFVTTDRNNFVADGTVREGQAADQVGRSRLWAITFSDVTKIATDGKPVGKLELLLDGTEGGDMFDNVTIDKLGRITLNEDTGNARHVAKIWQYDTNNGTFAAIFKADPAKFGEIANGMYVAPTAPFTDDKESSGVVDASDVFADATWFKPGAQALLTVVQAHFVYDAKDPVGLKLYEGGQLLLLTKTP
jgi:hypothetical protein